MRRRHHRLAECLLSERVEPAHAVHPVPRKHPAAKGGGLILLPQKPILPSGGISNVACITVR